MQTRTCIVAKSGDLLSEAIAEGMVAEIVADKAAAVKMFAGKIAAAKLVAGKIAADKIVVAVRLRKGERRSMPWVRKCAGLMGHDIARLGPAPSE